MFIKTSKIAALLMGVLLISCGRSQEEEKIILRPVSYTEVGVSGKNFSRTFSGTATTDKVVNLSFRNSGIITEFNLSLGKTVKKGELLGRLDNVQARLNYENSLSSLNSAKSQLNTSKLSLDRVRALFEKGSTSLSDYEAAKNNYRSAKANYESAERGVDIQKEQVNYGYLYAPGDGVIAQVNAEIDENVTPGQIIAVLNQGRDMQISLGLPENVINRVKEGIEVNIQMSSIQGESFRGIVDEVSPSIDPLSSTYPVSVKVIDTSDQIKSGMAANVTFQFEEASKTEEALVIPAKAVGEDDQGNFVFLVESIGDSTVVKKQPIKVGELTSEGFEILNGLNPGQRVAIAGLQTLLDGQQVKLQ